MIIASVYYLLGFLDTFHKDELYEKSDILIIFLSKKS